MRQGFDVVRGDRIIVIDADYTYPATAVLTISGQLDSFDLVAGARYRGRGWIPPLHRLGNSLLSVLLRFLYAQRRTDPLTGIYGIHREALETMALRSNGFGIEAEMAIKSACAGLRIAEIPITYRPRVGRTKLRVFTDGLAISRTILGLIVASKPWVTLAAAGFPVYLFGCILVALAVREPLDAAVEVAACVFLIALALIALSRRRSGMPPRDPDAARGALVCHRAARPATRVIGVFCAFGCLAAVPPIVLVCAGASFRSIAGLELLGIVLAPFAIRLKASRATLRACVDGDSQV